MLHAEDNEETLEEKVDELRKTLDRLEEEWENVYEQISRMTTSKLTDPRYPLTDWELLYLPTRAQRMRLRATIQALQNRLTNTPTPEHERVEIDGISKETLYGAGLPSLDEVVQALRTATEGPDSTVFNVMQLAKEEFDIDCDELANFVMAGMKLRGGADS